jgi:lipoic acid synthetase
VAEAVQQLNLDYVVVTSVTRDDLEDGGARHFAETIRSIRVTIPETHIEVLIPDFKGDRAALKTVLEARPNVLNHNLETVRRLYPVVRPQAGYDRSLEILRYVTENYPQIPAKSGLMLGLGETRDEIIGTLSDVLHVGCRILTLGQYLQPTKAHLKIERYLAPHEFTELKDIALEMGFGEVASGPFIRSSYRAKEIYHALK